MYHQRAADELVNEQLKDFGTEKLPFKSFAANAVFYYLMLIAFFLFSAFRKDVAKGIIDKSIIDENSHAKTFRRKLIDIAGKIIHKSGKIILKVASYIYEKLNIYDLWKRCNNAPGILNA